MDMPSFQLGKLRSKHIIMSIFSSCMFYEESSLFMFKLSTSYRKLLIQNNQLLDNLSKRPPVYNIDLDQVIIDPKYFILTTFRKGKYCAHTIWTVKSNKALQLFIDLFTLLKERPNIYLDRLSLDLDSWSTDDNPPLPSLDLLKFIKLNFCLIGLKVSIIANISLIKYLKSIFFTIF